MMTAIQSMPKPRLKKRAVFTSIATVIALLLSSFSPLLAEEGVSASDRQARINAGFKKGKTFYDAGKFDEAYREWESIDPYLDETSSVRKVIEFLKHRAPTAVKSAPPSTPAPVSVPAPASTQIASSEITVAPVAVPGSMPVLIDEATQKIEAEERRAASEVSARKDAADENARRQAAVDTAFERGKTAYEAGDLVSAISAWKEAADVLGDESLRRALDDLESRRLAVINAPAPVPAQGGVTIPSELKEMLERAAAKSEDEARLASGKRSAAAGKTSRRQEEIRAAFENGRRLYNAGDLDGALTEWERLASSVDDGETVRKLITSIRADREAARKAFDPATSVPNETRLPKELLSDLEAASQKTKVQAAEARARIAEAEKAAATSSESDRRIRESFDRGRSLFESGKTAEAIAEWEKLPVPAGAGPALSALKENYRLLLDAESASSAGAPATPAFSSEELAVFLDTGSRAGECGSLVG
jgi:tetratricopeptide (TPR) repeat protein